ncbi:hypothetical protein TYRP_009661, partial [Tyrophagus putrescentiae]
LIMHSAGIPPASLDPSPPFLRHCSTSNRQKGAGEKRLNSEMYLLCRAPSPFFMPVLLLMVINGMEV